jgi:putative redox protein
VTINILYRGQLHCEAIHDGSRAMIQTDAPLDNRGKGEAFSPTDLVAAALGTCIMTVMGLAAQDMEVDLEGASARVDKVMAASPSRRIGSLSVHVDIPAKVPADIRVKLEKVALTCPVKPSLHPDVILNISFCWA